jgi:hypothetical protein
MDSTYNAFNSRDRALRGFKRQFGYTKVAISQPGNEYLADQTLSVLVNLWMAPGSCTSLPDELDPECQRGLAVAG